MSKLLTITWSYDSESNYADGFLYKSFVKNNSKNNFINFHFNRNLYKKLEEDFREKFGYQYEYLLYRIFLFKDILKEIKDEYIICSDTNDVVCLGNINELTDYQIPSSVIFSSEIHQYPNKNNWNIYPNKNDRTFLNAGLFTGSISSISLLIESCIKNIFPLEYKDFGGDQGVYTYYFIHKNQDTIILDKNSKFFLNTYLRSTDSFYKENQKLINKENNFKPLFIHDNGWNFGSPRFIEKFDLLN
jgi:hypothetical protein